MNSSKADGQRLTKDGRMKMDPVFIRDGAEIIFSAQETPTQLSLMRLKLADGSTERFHPQATTSEFEPSFTLDGRWYAFVQSRGNLNLKVVIRDTRQNKDAVYDSGAGFVTPRRPSFAPDGSRVLIALPGGTGQEIIAVDTQGKNLKVIATGALNSGPAFSPDGKRIAFASSRDGGFDIYSMNADGGDVRRLTKTPGLDLRPSWSPDGERLAFTSNRDGNYEIYVMNADGGDQRRLTRNDERDDYATWHPDGKRLVFMAERNGKFDLEMIAVG